MSETCKLTGKRVWEIEEDKLQQECNSKTVCWFMFLNDNCLNGKVSFYFLNFKFILLVREKGSYKALLRGVYIFRVPKRGGKGVFKMWGGGSRRGGERWGTVGNGGERWGTVGNGGERWVVKAKGKCIKHSSLTGITC